MSNQALKIKPKFYFASWGYTSKDFKKWGKKGGRPAKYVSNAERQKAYRRRKAQAKIENGEVQGILNMTTGRISKRRLKVVVGMD